MSSGINDEAVNDLEALRATSRRSRPRSPHSRDIKPRIPAAPRARHRRRIAVTSSNRWVRRPRAWWWVA